MEEIAYDVLTTAGICLLWCNINYGFSMLKDATDVMFCSSYCASVGK